jgi:hypothetical protein
MGKSRAIWNEVTSCSYKSSPSWGGNNDVKQTTYVGSSASNSQELATMEVSKRIYDKFVVFNYYIDQKLITQAIFTNNQDRAGSFLGKRSKNFMNSTNQYEHSLNKKLKQ